VSTALKQLMEKDLVARGEEGGYTIVDPTFAIWIAGNRSELRSVAGPYHLGSEAEREVCAHLGREGFSLIYRSRGSRGAFDLLALLGAQQVGLQVKRTARLPLYLSVDERNRMIEWGRQLGWIPVLAAYLPDEDRCLYFDVRETGEELERRVRFDAGAGEEQLLGLISLGP
jgi:Holliday junction resolvase